MAEVEVVGRFHCGRVVRGRPEALRQWRVTTGGRDTAVAVSRLLGGELSDAGEWEVLSGSATVRVVVEGTAERSLCFRLAGAWGLGVFEFGSGVWTLEQVWGDVAARLSGFGGPVLCELVIGPVLVTTSMGTHVRFLRPGLRLLGPWAVAE